MARLEIGFNVNNLFNTLGFRANNGAGRDGAGDGTGGQSGDLRQFGDAGPHDDRLDQIPLLSKALRVASREEAGTEGQLPARLFHGTKTPRGEMMDNKPIRSVLIVGGHGGLDERGDAGACPAARMLRHAGRIRRDRHVGVGEATIRRSACSTRRWASTSAPL
jgi:hypothetical protein